MIAGIVLAAGRSARLGRPKQLLPYRRRPLLFWALAALAESGIDTLIVVLGHDAEAIRREVDLGEARVVLNPHHAEGMSTSLQAGLAALDGDADVQAAVVTVGDQPLLRSATFDALIEAYGESGAAIVAADYGGHQGTPMLLSRAVWPLARAIHSDRGARALLRDYPELVVTVPVDPASAVDIDTWEDYETLTDGAV